MSDVHDAPGWQQLAPRVSQRAFSISVAQRWMFAGQGWSPTTGGPHARYQRRSVLAPGQPCIALLTACTMVDTVGRSTASHGGSQMGPHTGLQKAEHASADA